MVKTAKPILEVAWRGLSTPPGTLQDCLPGQSRRGNPESTGLHNEGSGGGRGGLPGGGSAASRSSGAAHLTCSLTAGVEMPWGQGC